MVEAGVRGTYREPLVRWRVGRVTCTACGLARDVAPAQGDDYRLWYRTAVGGEPLWARNRGELELLIGWLSGTLREADLGPADRAIVEIVPAAVTARRAEAVERLCALRDER